MNFVKTSLFLIGFVSLSATFPTDDPTYINGIKAWHQKRIESLKSENGWLNLAGLFWLDEGKNTFGTNANNSVVFPAGKGAPVMGHFTLNNGTVWMEANPQANVLVQKKLVTSPIQLFPSSEELVAESGSLRWFVIKRGDKYGIRLRDLQSPEIEHFKGIETYPIAPSWRVAARLEPATDKKIPITDILGQTNLQTSPGTLVFTIEGKEYRLDAVESGKQLFIIFADQTTGKQTYGAGRYVYTDLPDANGITYLDFNKATNPPCAFTPYATCPLPPKQNRLPIAVTAGEKKYDSH
ncbi:MAG: DUF1684 domain-containing protein [Spirosomataceae bacterium]